MKSHNVFFQGENQEVVRKLRKKIFSHQPQFVQVGWISFSKYSIHAASAFYFVTERDFHRSKQST